VLSAQVNAVIAVPVMAVMMLLAHNREIMGKYAERAPHAPRLVRHRHHARCRGGDVPD
jgi:Mn2+/Fe2+ NRAMP family transporter